MAWVIAAWLCVWLGASVALQCMPRNVALRRSWLGWCFPEWRFFAPEPCDFDYLLLYRTYAEPRKLAEVRFDERRSWAWVWNPSGRRQKIFRDLADSLVMLASTECDEGELTDGVCRSDPYVAILAFCAAIPSEADLIQFGIARQRPKDEAEISFLSRWHYCR